MKAILLVSFLSFTTLIFGKNDRDIIKEIDDINSSASVFYKNEEIVKSFKKFIIAKALSDSIQDTYGSAYANYNLGNIYNLMENYESAKESYFLSLKDSERIDDTYLIASASRNLAAIFKEERNFSKAHEYLMNALKTVSKHNLHKSSEITTLKTVEFETRLNLCELYITTGNFQEAIVNLLKVGDYIKYNSVTPSEESYYNYIYGSYYTHKKLYNNANSKFKKAVNLIETDEDGIDYMLLSKVHKQLSLSLAKSGNSDEAFLNLLKHNSFKDKFLNEEKVRQNSISKTKFLIEDYKNNAEKANTERLLQLEIANKIQRVNIIVIVASLLLFISLVLICFGYITKRKLSSKLKLRNEQLEIAKNEALKSSELKSKFISNVSHELRTPLYGVVGLTSIMLESNDLTSRDVKYLKSLKYSGDYLLNLINDILHVGKIESNNVELNNSSVNIQALIQNVTDSFDYGLEESGNKIHIIIDDCLPEYVMCDKLRLTQVLFNLIGNSIKFTKNGNIYVKAILQGTNDNLAEIRFEINDDGPGIPKEKQATIFDNFTQLAENSNTNYQGAGLGLSITNKIVGLFDSKIELDSEVDKGATFGFVVRFEIDFKAIEHIKSKKVNKIFSTTDSENIKILIAEDNKINQIVTSNLLKKHNFKFDIVENGLEAVEAFKNDNYDLILMDINMPKMNGNQATIEIRKIDRHLPIIALTASNQDELNENILDIGFDDIITKPFDNELFFNTINNLLKQSKFNNIDDVKDDENALYLAS
ncbi:response regulator [uncultured Algibacter sp.]|uniref:response regulator n=1 Tax=uncultured Algibacter sp. TaxID=298659 RepID=UPI002609003E|nr:response regulator [uncultured Algibacter sp.]